MLISWVLPLPGNQQLRGLLSIKDKTALVFHKDRFPQPVLFMFSQTNVARKGPGHSWSRWPMFKHGQCHSHCRCFCFWFIGRQTLILAQRMEWVVGLGPEACWNHCQLIKNQVPWCWNYNIPGNQANAMGVGALAAFITRSSSIEVLNMQHEEVQGPVSI